MDQKERKSGLALLPFVIFVGLYLGVGIYLSMQKVDMAFYQFPILVACMIGIFSAFALHKGTLDEKFNAFIKGMGDGDIMTMCIIYLLAGSFSAVSSAIGSVESTVNLALSFIPSQFLLVGVFIVGAFLSLAMGTSMGTIGAVAPIALGLAQAANLPIALTAGAVLGGAMFGDNLSVISDTTIAATKSQNVEMKDKFRLNSKLAFPAAIITIVLLFIFGRPEVAPEVAQLEYNVVKVIPYLFVLVAALAGMNVFVVLAGGSVISLIIGLLTSSTTFLDGTSAMGAGMLGMSEIFILSILVGGLANMVKQAGGIAWLIEKLRSGIRSRSSAELGIAGLVSALDLAAANNTVAIIISGPIAKQLTNEFKVDPRRSASLLDTFSCVFQGLIPYGAQMLLMIKLTEGAANPLEVIPMTWYCLILAVISLVSIFIPFADGAIKKDPWNFEHDCPESKVVNK